MTVLSSLIQWGVSELSHSGSPRLDAELLLAHVLQEDRLWMIAHADEEVSEHDEITFRKLISRRKDSEPIAYILGQKEFYGRDFLVTPDVLIPRPETEHLIEHALQVLSKSSSPQNILELGVGSGCILISIALERIPDEGLYVGIDQSLKALEVAQKNAEALSVSVPIQWIQSDWFSALSDQTFDLIVSNPPYVSPNAELQPDLQFEPEKALFSEDNGLSDIFHIIDHAKRYLVPSGVLLLECGADQSEFIRKYAEQSGYSYESFQDLQGIPRVIKLVIAS